MKSGFTLIELVIGLFIASIMLVSLYSSFYVTSKVIKNSEDIIGHDIHIAILGHQLEHDIDGIFAPSSTPITTTTTTQPSAQPNEQKPTDQQKESTPKEIKDIFMSTNNKDGSLRMLTFITINPLETYHKEGPSSRMVRVVYKLVPNEDKTAFTLTRQESTNLDLKAFETKGAQSIRAYELSDMIKSIEIEFKYPEEQKQATKETKESKQEQQKISYITVKEWTPEQQQSKEKKSVPQIPQFIIVTITMWDVHHTREQTHIMSYAIPSFSPQKAPKEKAPQEKRPTVPRQLSSNPQRSSTSGPK